MPEYQPRRNRRYGGIINHFNPTIQQVNSVNNKGVEHITANGGSDNVLNSHTHQDVNSPHYEAGPRSAAPIQSEPTNPPPTSSDPTNPPPTPSNPPDPPPTPADSTNPPPTPSDAANPPPTPTDSTNPPQTPTDSTSPPQTPTDSTNPPPTPTDSTNPPPTPTDPSIPPPAPTDPKNPPPTPTDFTNPQPIQSDPSNPLPPQQPYTDSAGDNVPLSDAINPPPTQSGPTNPPSPQKPYTDSTGNDVADAPQESAHRSANPTRQRVVGTGNSGILDVDARGGGNNDFDDDNDESLNSPHVVNSASHLPSSGQPRRGISRSGNTNDPTIQDVVVKNNAGIAHVTAGGGSGNRLRLHRHQDLNSPHYERPVAPAQPPRAPTTPNVAGNDSDWF